MATGVEKWTQVEFRSYVQNVIKQWRNGELYTSMGVSEKDIVIGHGQGPPDPKSKSHPFNKMLECAASDIVQKLDIKARKATKTILKQIQEHRQVWAEMILTGGSGSGNNEDDDSTSHLADPSTPSKVKQEETDEVDEEVLDDGFQEEHQEDTMVQDVVAKQEDDSENDVLDDDAEIGLEDDESSSAAEKIEAKREAKRERFEKERDDILADVPKQVKDRFGKIFFSKWSINILPVLVLSPYSVPPGPVRNMWFDMYHKVSSLCSCT